MIGDYRSILPVLAYAYFHLNLIQDMVHYDPTACTCARCLSVMVNTLSSLKYNIFNIHQNIMSILHIYILVRYSTFSVHVLLAEIGKSES